MRTHPRISHVSGVDSGVDQIDHARHQHPDHCSHPQKKIVLRGKERLR